MKLTRLLWLIAAFMVAFTHAALAGEDADFQHLCRVFLLTPKVDGYGDFFEKDIIAAEKMGMELCEYSIGGLIAKNRPSLAEMLRAVEEETGVEPGITACFRDDKYRPRAEGKANDPRDSFHGGTNVTKGYGDGEACDIVGLAHNRRERDERNAVVWAWLRKNDERFGWKLIYGECDGGHVAPLKGREYYAKFGAWNRPCKHGTRIAKGKRRSARFASLPGARHAPH